jgi:hypothetical protein
VFTNKSIRIIKSLNVKFGAISGTLFIYFLYFPYETYNTVFILGWTSPAGYLPELGINPASGKIIHPAGPRVRCRTGIEPGTAVQQPSALTAEAAAP